MRILGIIPARGGSKGVPGKNIKPLSGKPLIQYTIEHARASKKLTRIIVSTDDPEIAEVSLRGGVEVPFLRPHHLAQDDTPTLLVVQHVLQFYQESGDVFDAICLLHPTAPFRTPGLIDRAIDAFVSSEADSLISVRSVPEEYNPHWVFEQNAAGYLHISTGEKTIIPRRQELPPAYIRDGAIYLTKVPVVMGGSLYGQHISWVENTGSMHVNIDTPRDWEEAEHLASEYNRICAASQES